MPRLITLIVVAVAGCVGGCCIGTPPRDVAHALARVNDNLRQIDQPLYASGLTSFKLRDAEQRTRRIIAQEARMLYQNPRCLLFDVKSLAGTVAQFGSNDTEYWLWIEPEVRKLWLGSWEPIDSGGGSALAIPPNDLVDALLLRPIPEVDANGEPPLLERRGLHHWLVYMRSDGEGTRSIRLDRCEPYQPREIVDRLTDGRIVMRAVLKSYRRVAGEGPFTPRHYEMYWPLDEAELRLDVHRAKFRPDLPAEVFDTPTRWSGEVECLDDVVAPLSYAPVEGDTRS